MKVFGIQQRIWRAIYPTLVYILMSTAISLIIVVIHTVTNLDSMQLTGDVNDIERIVEVAMAYMTENALLVSLYGYIAALAVFIPIWIKTKARYPRWNGGRLSLPVALCAVGAAIGFNMLFSVIITFTGVTELFPSYDLVVDVVTGGSLVIQIIAVGLIAPVAEELCFRGITMNRMSDTKIWLALSVQAVLFGILHMNIVQGAYAALLGVFLGFLTIRYRSVIYAIIAHIAFNMYSIIISTVESELVLTIVSIVIIPVTVVSIIGLIRCKRPEPYTSPETAPAVGPRLNDTRAGM